ncbi:MAG: hypothetical protein H7X94_07650, partial [Vallitaleaceae bacterium]|nr:hypothetical protein [Vallitaleaceae bacterium]
GLAMLNEGLYEYEHMMQPDGVIGITLLRVNGIISWSAKGEQWKVPGNQCIRDIEVGFAIHPYCGDFYQAEIAQVTKDYQVPLLAYFQPVEVKKFLGGRAAVQDSCIDETFMRKDKYSNIRLERAGSFVSIMGEGVVLSALKAAESGEGIILRVYNTLPVINEFSVHCHKDFNGVTRVNLDERVCGLIESDGSATEKIIINPKEIVTLLLT